MENASTNFNPRKASSRTGVRGKNFETIDDVIKERKQVLGFDPYLSANTLRSISLKYSFPKGKRADPRQ